MFCIAITVILFGCSPVIGQEVFGESEEIQSDPALENSEEIYRLKLPTDDSEDSSQLKTIRNDEEYDVGKILSHLQIIQRPRPVINLRPISGGHTVIHKNNKEQHVSHHDEYVPVKITSDTEYVIKPQHDSHSQHHHGETIVKPGSHGHNYQIPEHSHHGEYNHGYDSYGSNNHGNEYNTHAHVDKDHVPIHHTYYDHGHGNHKYNNHGHDNHGHRNHGYNNHGHDNHEYNHYEHDNHEYNHYGHDNHGYNNHGHNNHKYNHYGHGNHEDNHHGYDNNEYNNHGHDSNGNHGYIGDKYPHDRPTHLNLHHGKPHKHHNLAHKPSTHGSYSHPSRPHGKPHGDYKPHHDHGENGYHHAHEYSRPHENYHGDHKPHHGGNKHHQDHKPYDHGNYGHSHHKYHEKPHPGYDLHHNNHRPYHNGYESHSYSTHDKPHNNYEVHEDEDDNQQRPSYYLGDHKPHKQHNVGHLVSQHSSHKPVNNVHKPIEPAHKPHHENYHYKPSKPHGDTHKYHGQSHSPGSLWKPHMSGINSHKTEKPKNYQNQNEQIKSDLELIDVDNDEAVTDMEKLDSGSNLHKITPDNHIKEGSYSTTPKPGSSQIKKNSTHVETMNSLGDKVNGKPSQTVGQLVGLTHGNANKPNSSHSQFTSKPNSHKNNKSPIITQTNTGNTLKPHTMTSYEKPKPILASSANRPTISTNQLSETQLNLNRPDQKPNPIASAHKPHNSNYVPNEHYDNNYYEATETLLSSDQDSSSIEENVHQQLIFHPNNEESSEAFVDNSQEHISSYENGLDSSIDYVSGHHFNIPDENHYDQHSHENHDYEHQHHLLNEEESTETSGENYHENYSQDNIHQSHISHSQDNNHQSHISHSHHGNDPHRQQSHSQKPGYNHYGHSHNDRPNKCGSSHEQKLQEYHKEYFRPNYDQQSSHSNHHNYYGQPVNNHHTHQVSKPFNIDHGPYGVSGIFINNFKKRPSSWYNNGHREYVEDSQETLGDNNQADYRERRDNYREDSSFESDNEREEKENYLGRSQIFENPHKFLSENPDNIFENPISRRNRYSGYGIYEEKSSNIVPERFVVNIKDRIPSTPGYYLEDNELMYEAERALAYMVNPYAYVSRPHHTGLQYTSHQNFVLDPNHHQHDLYNHAHPNHGQQSNHHEYGVQTPHYHHSQGIETTLGFNPSSHNTEHHNHLVHNQPHQGASHHHNSNETPVKYVYIPVLYNFQPVSHKSLLTSSPTLSSNLELNRSNADYFNRLALSGLDTVMHDEEQLVKPTLEVFKTPTHNSPSIPVKPPQITQGGSPFLFQLLSGTNLDTFSENVDLKSRDSEGYLRKVEPLKREDVKVESEKPPSRPTSNWYQTQELHEDYASQCKDIWDSILLAQESGTNKQERLLSKSNDEVSTAIQNLERKVESLIKKKKRSSTLETESGQELKDSLESTCIEVLKNALLAQLEILDIKRREQANKNQSQTMEKLEADKEIADKEKADKEKADAVTPLEVTESAPLEMLNTDTEEHEKDDLPIIFEKDQVGLSDSEEEQENTSFSQDYHW